MTFPMPAAILDSLHRIKRGALVAGIVAGIACGVAAWFDPASFFSAYLSAFLFFLSIAHGCLALTMVYHLTGGAWGFLIRNILEAGMRTLPLLAILFLPVAAGVNYLLLWTDPQAVAASAELQHKQLYLNIPFFLIRAVLYFLIWLGIS